MSYQRDELASVPTRNRGKAAQREQPLCVGGLPQVQLRAAEMRLNAPGILHGFDGSVIGPKAERILGERRGLVFNLERSFVHPDGDLLPGQAVFAKESPVFEADKAMSIEMTDKLGGIQHAGEHHVGVHPSQRATQHRLRTVPPILARTQVQQNLGGCIFCSRQELPQTQE